jgi:phosphosulfolactate synthase (CoM biosynthesis protein A)
MSFGFSTKSNELRPHFLNFLAKLVDIDRVWWDARENKLCEEHVDIFGGFETLKA